MDYSIFRDLETIMFRLTHSVFFFVQGRPVAPDFAAAMSDPKKLRELMKKEKERRAGGDVPPVRQYIEERCPCEV